MSYIFEKTTDFDNIFGEDPDRLQLFFAHVFSSMGLVFKKLQAKTYFFTFSKTLKNTYMTSKIHPPKHRHYEFFSYFGLGLKQSIAIFSAIQNVIWSWIDDFRAFWKLPDFPLLACFFTWFFTVFACKISTYSCWEHLKYNHWRENWKYRWPHIDCEGVGWPSIDWEGV